jgi:transcriptional regulator with XRE-family HTH domain
MDNFFSSNLEYLRKMRNLSLQALADKTGISKSAIESYEKGQSSPTLDKLLLIIQYFGCTLDEITEKDMRHPVISVAREPEVIYGSEVERLKIENNALREALREIGKGIKQ